MTETEDILPQEGQVHGQRKHTAGILIFSGRFSDRNNSEKSFVRQLLKGLSVTKDATLGSHIRWYQINPRSYT